MSLRQPAARGARSNAISISAYHRRFRARLRGQHWWVFGAPIPRIKARVAELGGTVLAGPPADFGKLIAHEKWANVVKFAKIKPD
jgi:hypothetical protein